MAALPPRHYALTPNLPVLVITMIKSIQHITINIVDLAKSVAFYGELLGLPRLDDVEMDDHVLHYFVLPGGTRLELIEYAQRTPIACDPLTARGRFRHIALETNNLDALAEKIPLYGGHILQPPKYVEKLGFLGMLAEDPNGCELEFTETVPDGPWYQKQKEI